ncbi:MULTISPECIES: hypothetical protein [Pseudomonas]|jgi:hypothetical protein|uniref:Homing endonuclease LAGLIDADG domain-containing protein n=1 Tax=Pseudomonas chlororaphis TaxID=587753 RepID=A0AB34C7I2_9PSED|nr:MULTISPECIES: hypothetical protein [Pseudomonas]AUG01417.1 hypothetical protein CXQ81_12655 [Pseudomonas sp. 09C 129]AZD01309.1 hypothetical protein C4K27_2114 [Pseudomonas chlororaphis subsp. chlororaphis]AZD07473.1 hypothetical protein C4K26_2069 [Pseudomonas chlororaphis]EJL07958.1 hypothetical protein Pchl3084_2023 [Pseudomonas chlororaphis subsp. aureofaciens 30-84]KAA5843538.1 hypothetical protein F2A38_09680 [Pseudomonas chlororaphis]
MQEFAYLLITNDLNAMRTIAACSTEGLYEVKRGIFTFRSEANVDYLHRVLAIVSDEFGIIPVQQAEFKTNRATISKAFSQLC